MANGDSSAAPARVEHADLTFRCRWEDWIDVAMGREDARVALLKGKIRPRGSLSMLWRAGSMFAV